MNSTREELLFGFALTKPAAERAAFLDRECGDDAALRRRIEALLAAHEQATGFLPVDSKLESVATVIVETPPTEEAGLLIGRYKLLEKLGEGGFGAVWLAEQKEPVRRKIALKIIKLGMDTKQVVARFEAERQALALMDHPNISKVLDAGTADNGRPYFVMELVRGIPITRFCDENKMATQERLDLFIKVCHAIQHAHQKGIIHRDIKPSNVLVTLHDGVPVPKVIDFGIAKATQQELTDKTIHTQFQQFIGTPAYMSPEQAEMSGLDIDTRSDIYSLGVLLYELLTGKTPFDGNELLMSGLDEMRRTIREREPLRPSTRLDSLEGEERTTTAKRRGADPAKLASLLRGDLDWIVMKALEKDRTRRYETANGFATDIQRHLNNEPVVARPPSAAYRFQKLVQRNKLAFAAGVAVTAALVFGLTISTWSFFRERAAHQRSIAAEREQSRLREDAEKAQANAVAQRQKAEAQALIARQNLYASDMNLALQAQEANNLGYVLDLLDRHRPRSGQADLRGWEWRYLWRRCQSDAIQILGSHSNTVYDAVFSPNGDVLATTSSDHAIKIWDMSTKREAATLKVDASVGRTEFLQDGKTLAAVCSDGTLRLWDVSTRREVARRQLGQDPLAVAFSAGGGVVAFCEANGTVNLWDVGTQTHIATLQGKNPARCLAFSRDGRMLAAGYWVEKTVGLWDLSSKEQILFSTNHTDGIMSVAFSFDGKTLASGSADWTVKLWDIATRQETRTLTGHEAGIRRLAFSPDDNTLASASSDHSIKLWNVGTGREISTLHGHLNEVWAMAMTLDGRTLATGTKTEGAVTLWSTTPKRKERMSQIFSSELARYIGSAVTISPDATTLLTVYANRTIGVWDTAALRETANFPCNISNMTGFAVSPSGKFIAIGERSGTVRLLEASTKHEVVNLAGPGAAVESIAFSPDGKNLAWASSDRKIRVLEITTQQLLPEITLQGKWPTVLAFSANDSMIGQGDNDGTAEIFDMTNGKSLALLKGHNEGIGGVAFLPDGKTVATAGFDQAVKLWDIKSQRELVTFGGQPFAYFALAVSPDGRRLAGGGGDGAVRLWDTATYQQVATLKGITGDEIFALAFSLDGNTLLAGGRKALYVWRASTLAETDVVSAAATQASSR